MPSYHPDLPQGHDLSCSDWPWQGGHHSCLQEVSVLDWGCYVRPLGFLSNKCVYYTHINYSWNFHQNIFTLTISFIVFNAAIEFVLIYRPHPVYGVEFQSFWRSSLISLSELLHTESVFFWKLTMSGTIQHAYIEMNQTTSIVVWTKTNLPLLYYSHFCLTSIISLW